MGPEMDIVLSRQEEAEVVKLALRLKAWLVPDMNYPVPRPLQIRSYSDYEKYRGQERLFFILHASFMVTPLEMHEIEKEGRTVYYIVQKNGGPTIDFLSSVEYEEDGKSYVGSGFLAYHGTFWNPETHRNEKAPEALISFYAALTGMVKQIAVRTKVGARIYWIGREIAAQIERGEKYLGIGADVGASDNPS